jgi:hypothetical protein
VIIRVRKPRRWATGRPSNIRVRKLAWVAHIRTTKSSRISQGKLSSARPFRRPAAENPTKQRRYFVKEGVFLDHEDEKPITCVGEVVKGISDRLPVDLKTLFPKLSLR